MSILDFSQSPFVTVCETDVSKQYILQNVTSSNFSAVGALQNYSDSTSYQLSTSTSLYECHSPFQLFWVIAVFLIGFIWGVYKISCMIRD